MALEPYQSPKQQVQAILDKLPPDASFDDIEYHLYVQRKIERGLAAKERGEVLSHEEAKLRMKRWLEG